MTEPSAESFRPPGGPRPPAPPGAADPRPGPDPRDPGPPIQVHIGGVLIGDLGNQAVDALLLNAIVLRGTAVGSWLEQHGVRSADVEATFPGATWPLPDRYRVRLDP